MKVRHLMMALFLNWLTVGCEDEPVSQVPVEVDHSLSARTDQMIDWILDSYDSIEGAFSEAESELRKTDRPIEQILSALELSVGFNANESKIKNLELVDLKREWLQLREEYEGQALSAPSPERATLRNAVSEMDMMIEGKIEPLLEYDFHRLEKIDLALKDAVVRWRSSASAFRDINTKQASGKTADLISEFSKRHLGSIIMQRKAAFGNAESKFILGVIYENGEGVSEDQENAEHWYLKALTEGHVRAATRLGEMYGKERDAEMERLTRVSDWMLNAYDGIELSFSHAQTALRVMDRPIEGILSELDSSVSSITREAWDKQKEMIVIKKGLTTLRAKFGQLASAFPSSSKVGLGGSLYEIDEALAGKIKPLEEYDFPRMEKIELDVKDSVARWKIAAESFVMVDSEMANKKTVGLISDYFRENLTMTIKQRKAVYGDAQSQYGLGLMHSKGTVVAKDDGEAAKWWIKSAMQGHTNAQGNLGFLYAHGIGVPQDYNKAVDLWTLASRKGDAFSQYNLGYSYYCGHGVPQNYKEAYKWCGKAAEQGDVNAQKALAVMYDYGFGVDKDSKKALEWYRKAAEQGDAEALQKLNPKENPIRGKAWVEVEGEVSFLHDSRTEFTLDGQKIVKISKGDFKMLSNGRVSVRIGSIPFGKHSIRVTHPNYLPWNDQFEVVRDGSLMLYAQSSILTASLVANGVPTGSSIYIDGHLKGTIPCRFSLFPEREYEVLALKPGYDSKILQVRLEANRTMNWNFELTNRTERILSAYIEKEGYGEISLGGSKISDLTAFASLAKKATRLDLSNNDITDVSSLSKLRKLKFLDLSGNQISDISPLNGLAELEYLDLGSNGIEIVSPLKDLPNLEYLDLSSNKLELVSPLKDLPKLKRLILIGQKWTPAARQEQFRGIRQYMIKHGQRYLLNGMKGCEVIFDPSL